MASTTASATDLMNVVPIDAGSRANVVAVIDSLALRKAALEDALLQKLNALRQMCLKEAELTGVMSTDYPLAPGESAPPPPPTSRRRVGTTFSIPNDMLITTQRTPEAEYLAKLELEHNVQAQIAKAAQKLANDTTVSKAIHKQRQKNYQQARAKLEDLAKQVKEMRAYNEQKMIQTLGRGPTTTLVNRQLHVSGHNQPYNHQQHLVNGKIPVKPSPMCPIEAHRIAARRAHAAHIRQVSALSQLHNNHSNASLQNQFSHHNGEILNCPMSQSKSGADLTTNGSGKNYLSRHPSLERDAKEMISIALREKKSQEDAFRVPHAPLLQSQTNKSKVRSHSTSRTVLAEQTNNNNNVQSERRDEGSLNGKTMSCEKVSAPNAHPQQQQQQHLAQPLHRPPIAVGEPAKLVKEVRMRKIISPACPLHKHHLDNGHHHGQQNHNGGQTSDNCAEHLPPPLRPWTSMSISPTPHTPGLSNGNGFVYPAPTSQSALNLANRPLPPSPLAKTPSFAHAYATLPHPHSGSPRSLQAINIYDTVASDMDDGAGGGGAEMRRQLSHPHSNGGNVGHKSNGGDNAGGSRMTKIYRERAASYSESLAEAQNHDYETLSRIISRNAKSKHLDDDKIEKYQALPVKVDGDILPSKSQQETSAPAVILYPPTPAPTPSSASLSSIPTPLTTTVLSGIKQVPLSEQCLAITSNSIPTSQRHHSGSVNSNGSHPHLASSNHNVQRNDKLTINETDSHENEHETVSAAQHARSASHSQVYTNYPLLSKNSIYGSYEPSAASRASISSEHMMSESRSPLYCNGNSVFHYASSQSIPTSQYANASNNTSHMTSSSSIGLNTNIRPEMMNSYSHIGSSSTSINTTSTSNSIGTNTSNSNTNLHLNHENGLISPSISTHSSGSRAPSRSNSGTGSDSAATTMSSATTREIPAISQSKAHQEINSQILQQSSSSLPPLSGTNGYGSNGPLVVAPDPIPLSPNLPTHLLGDKGVEVDILNVGYFKPYWEETKPFELSDFYKYSSKHKSKNSSTSVTSAPPPPSNGTTEGTCRRANPQSALRPHETKKPHIAPISMKTPVIDDLSRGVEGSGAMNVADVSLLNETFLDRVAQTTDNWYSEVMEKAMPPPSSRATSNGSRVSRQDHASLARK